MTTTKPTPQDAIAKGYTARAYISFDDCDLDVLIRPDADLDGTFKAFCMDEHEWLHVTGWLLSGFTMDHGQ